MTPFPVDLSVMHRGQDYRLIGWRNYVRKNGTPTVLLEWATDCPCCGDGFVCTTPRHFVYPRRRCEACKTTGLVKFPDRPRWPPKRKPALAGAGSKASVKTARGAFIGMKT